MLVLAGPGSGKTHVLTTRVARLIEESSESRFKVLGLTFTTKAADEMSSRASEMLGPQAYRARLTTFHSFAVEILRQHGSHIGLRPDFEVLSHDEDRYLILDEAIEDSGASGRIPVAAKGRSIVALIDRLLRDGHTGGTAPLPPAAESRDWILPVYNAYLRLLVEGNHLDFGGLLVHCIRLLRERPRLARHYRTVYPFVCVDEYQDTNKAQDFLMRAIYPDKSANLFVVADDDQIIYEWNGASPERLRDLRDHYCMNVIQLPESYRCPASVVVLANALIGHNRLRTRERAPLVSASPSKESDNVRVRRFEDYRSEMSWVAHDIKARSLRADGCAILARSAKLLACAADALSDAGLSPYITQRKNEFESPLLRFVHSALRLANRPGDAEQLASLCLAYRELTNACVIPEDVMAESALEGKSFLDGFVNIARTSTTDANRPLLTSIKQDLLERLNYRRFVGAVFEWRGEVSDESGEGDEQRVWRSTERSISHGLGGDPPLSQLLQEFDLRQKTTPPGPGDIQCLTIHLAKGKEFQHVYLIGLVEDQLPSYYAIQGGERQIEEERRECFVAITRCSSTLTLSFARSYFGWPKARSRFLSEMGLTGSPIVRR